jgi:hypothetical protein
MVESIVNNKEKNTRIPTRSIATYGSSGIIFSNVRKCLVDLFLVYVNTTT